MRPVSSNRLDVSRDQATNPTSSTPGCATKTVCLPGGSQIAERSCSCSSWACARAMGAMAGSKRARNDVKTGSNAARLRAFNAGSSGGWNVPMKGAFIELFPQTGWCRVKCALLVARALDALWTYVYIARLRGEGPRFSLGPDVGLAGGPRLWGSRRGQERPGGGWEWQQRRRKARSGVVGTRRSVTTSLGGRL